MIDATAPLPDALTPRRVFLGTLVVVATAAAFWLAYYFQHLFFYLFVGVVIATAIRPLERWLRGRGLKHSTATMLVYAALAVAAIGLLSWLVPLVIGQAQKLTTQAPRTYSQVLEQLEHSSSAVLRRLAQRLPSSDSAPAKQVDNEAAEAAATVATAINYGDSLLQGLFAVAATLLIAFYWSLQEERTVRGLQLLLPVEKRDAAREFLGAIQEKLGAYFRGQAMLCLIVGLMNLVALYWIGVPYATTLALIAGILEAVPMFGPALGAIPAILVALSVEPKLALWVIGAAVLIQQVENYLLVPRIMDRSVGVNPVVTLLAIAAFGALMGIVGAVLAIPLAAMVQVFLDRWLLAREALAPVRQPGRDATSVMRYQAQELVHDVRMYLRDKQNRASIRNDALEEAVEALAGDIDLLLSREPAPAAAEESR